MQTMTQSKLLDTVEACAALRVSRSTLYRLVRQGKLRRSCVSTGRALFQASEIERVIETPLEQEWDFLTAAVPTANSEVSA